MVPLLSSLSCVKSVFVTVKPDWKKHMFHNLQEEELYKVAGLTIAASLEPFTQTWNIASLSLLYYLNSWGSSTRCANKLHDFCVTIPRCYKNICQQFFSSYHGIFCLRSIFFFFLPYDLIGFVRLDLIGTFFIRTVSNQGTYVFQLFLLSFLC